MGYYTRYDLEIRPNPPEVEHDLILETLEKNLSYNPLEEQCKWYEWPTTMKDLSEQYPDKLFVLRGEGEENGDQWIAYVKNGKSVFHQMPQWVPPPFDESSLA